MNEIMNGKDTKTDRELFERKGMRELAFYLVELHMDTQRSEAVPGAYKKHLRRSEPILGEALIEEIDRAISRLQS